MDLDFLLQRRFLVENGKIEMRLNRLALAMLVASPYAVAATQPVIIYKFGD